MIKILRIIIVVIFALLSLIHIYWAIAGSFGNGVGNEAVIPTINNRPVFHPSPALTLLVAFALFTAMLVILGQIGLFKAIIPNQFFYWGTLAIGLAFLCRAIGEFRLVGFFKKITDTKFAYWDTRLFSPLCLFIAIACFLLVIFYKEYE